ERERPPHRRPEHLRGREPG
ncbi:MAG: hypothetical protein AVDCRST_MAG13-2011, partial [uncultured Solirubrobacteraceae bacterium]